MTRCFQPLLALDLTMGLGSFPRERASVVQSFDAPPTKSFNGQTRRKPEGLLATHCPNLNLVCSEWKTSISKRLRKRFDSNYLPTAFTAVHTQKSWRKLGKSSIANRGRRRRTKAPAAFWCGGILRHQVALPVFVDRQRNALTEPKIRYPAALDSHLR